jgi:hypothetical protein
MQFFASYSSSFRRCLRRPSPTRNKRQRAQTPLCRALLFWYCAAILCALALTSPPIAALAAHDVFIPRYLLQQNNKVDEEKIIALIIWKFLLFIDFPSAPPGERFTIGIVGTSRVESYLVEIVRNKTLADGRAVEVKRIQSLEDLPQCNLVYVAPSENGKISQVLAKIRGRNIVSVGRSDDFLARGGMINFYIENTNLRFEYNNDEIMTANKLRFSSQLLRHGKQFSKAKE